MRDPIALAPGQRWKGRGLDLAILRVCDVDADAFHVTNTGQSCTGWCLDAAAILGNIDACCAVLVEPATGKAGT